MLRQLSSSLIRQPRYRSFASMAASSTQWKRVDLTSSSGPADASHYYVWPTAIEQSQQDDRSYRLIKLENGLQALLVHDAQADKSAASLDVSVGHLSDPVRIFHPRKRRLCF